MLSWLGKLMPYFIVRNFTKKFGSDFIHTQELGLCRGWRLGKGEWILWSQDNYDKMRENEKKSREWEEQEKEEEEKKEYKRLKEKFAEDGKREQE